MSSPSALIAALRIARRDAMRHKARSALVVAMVAIPVLGLSSADVLARTMQLSPGERVTREIGAADVAIQGPGGGTVTQGVDPADGFEPRGKHVLTSGSPASVALEARALAMIGARGPVATRVVTSALVTANGRLFDSDVYLLDLNNPLTAGIASVTAGHAPTTIDQVGVTQHLAKRLDVAIGDSIEVANQPRTVTAVVQDPNALNADTVYASAVSREDNRNPMLLAATTRPVTWAEVRQLNALGLTVTSRYVAEHPPADAPVINPPNRVTTADRIGIATVSVGLAVLEVVLLAGAAFAVGARRQRRDLALVAAAGGDTRQVRQIVLAGGLVLGAVGAVVGLGAGIAVARIALPEVSKLANRVPGAFDLRPLELFGILLIGICTGLISSVLPARAAGREDVVLALSGRRGALSTPKRVPAFGLAMVVIGALVAGHAASHANFWQILGGAVISELGFVFCAPAVVGAAGKLARFLPLAPRLALRDAARHRGRSGPAVAAIMAAIAGSVAVSAYFVSTEHRDRAIYMPQARIGQPVLKLIGGSHLAQRRAATLAVFGRDLGATSVTPVPTAECFVKGCRPLYLFASDTDANTVAVGGVSLLRTLSGRVDPAAEQALMNGSVIAFSAAPARLDRENIKTGTEYVLRRVPVFRDDVGRLGAAVGGIASPATAAALHAGTTVTTYVATTPRIPTQAQADRLNDQLGDPTAQVIIERGYHAGNYSVGLIALAIAAAIVTLGATAISVGLSMAESKPDLITLAAVGGRPRTRRFLVANQAGSVALLGAIQGVVAGIIPAWAILHAAKAIPFVMPWMTIAIVVLGIPLLAMLGTGAVAGSRLTLDRRPT